MAKVTKKDLKQYVDMRREIKLLKEDLAGGLHTVDSVKGSTRDFPFTETTFVIEGPDVKRKRQIQAQIDVLTAKCERVENFAKGIDSSFMRQLIDLHFLKGYGWGKVMRKTGCLIGQNAIRMRVERFLNKVL